MKKAIYLALIVIGVAIMTFFKLQEEMQKMNPFLADYNTPFETPPFSKIKNSHFEEAYNKGIQEKKRDIKRIIDNEEAPNFNNVILTLEKSGQTLSKVSSVFSLLEGAHTNDTIKQLSAKIYPELSKLNDEIYMNAKLFDKVKALYEDKMNQNYTVEQQTILKNYYDKFIRSGAELSQAQKLELGEINTELSALCLEFKTNVLESTNAFEMILEEKDLDGLSDDIIQAAKISAKEKGHDGKYLFTIHKPSMIPFLTYSTRRDLRKKIYDAYTNQCNLGDQYDNKNLVKKISNLRLKRAQLLGYKNHADFVLEENMAQNNENVFNLLNKMWQPAISRAKWEVKQMQAIADQEKANIKIEAHDWWYYAEKVKMRDFAMDEDMLRPYFKLENVIEGAFMVANKLYGITFHPIEGIDTYHEECKVFEVKDENGKHLAIYYADHHPRASKRGGAWMGELRQQHALNDEDERPLITNVMNFTKPTADKPSLLSVDETMTLFHEFGHAVHGILSKCTYPSVAGTNTPYDFVEFPSQVFENWAMAPEVLKLYSKHFETGEIIPDSLIEKIQKASHFNQGFATTEYMAATYLDMFYANITEPIEEDINQFETNKMNELGLIKEIIPRYRSTYFRHIFSNPMGYSANYYVYLWSEVLDADTYEFFKETDLFDPVKSKAFRNEVLSKGGTDDAMKMYKRFRGQAPKIESLIEKRGMISFIK